MNRLLKEQIKRDKERIEALKKLKSLKGNLLDAQMKEDMRHNYLYHILFDNFASKEKCTNAALENLKDRTPPIYSPGCCGGELRSDSEMLLPGNNQRIYLSMDNLHKGCPNG